MQTDKRRTQTWKQTRVDVDGTVTFNTCNFQPAITQIYFHLQIKENERGSNVIWFHHIQINIYVQRSMFITLIYSFLLKF